MNLDHAPQPTTLGLTQVERGKYYLDSEFLPPRECTVVLWAKGKTHWRKDMIETGKDRWSITQCLAGIGNCWWMLPEFPPGDEWENLWEVYVKKNNVV